MKHLLSILISALLLFSCIADKREALPTHKTKETGCFNTEPYGYAEMKAKSGEVASMRTKTPVYRISDSCATLVLRLPMAHTGLGRHYALERFYCGEWQPVQSTRVVFDDEFILSAPCEILFDFSLSGYVAPLHPGKYRIQKEVRNGQRLTTLTAEFMLWKE